MKSARLWPFLSFIFVYGSPSIATVKNVECDKPYAGAPFSYKILKALATTCIDNGKVKSLDDFILLIPEIYRSNFTFVYKSRSPEAESISVDYPRTILFGRDAKLLFAFTGDPSKPHYNELQVIEFKNEGRFTMNNISFPGPTGGTANELQEKVSFLENPSPKNPKGCVRCHGIDPHPIWDSYDLWPGVYGSVDSHIDKTTPEGKDYDRFLKNQRSKGRYAKLIWPDPELPKPTYAGSEDRFKAEEAVPPYFPGPIFDGDELRLEPNLRLSKLLPQLNAVRIVRKMKEKGSRYEKLRVGILSGMLGCQRFPIPQELKDKVLRALNANFQERILRQGDRTPLRSKEPIEFIDLEKAGCLNDLAYAAKLLDLDTDDLFLTLEKGTYSAFDGSMDIGRMVRTEIYRDVMSEIPALKSYFSTSGYPYTSGYGDDKREDEVKENLDTVNGDLAISSEDHEKVCRILEKDRSFKAPTLLAPNDSRSVTASGTRVRFRDLRQRCAECHTERSEDYPPIPFDKPAKLMKRLKNDEVIRKKILLRLSPGAEAPMPPDANAKEREALRRSLKLYLHSIKVD